MTDHPAIQYVARQDSERGNWPSPRPSPRTSQSTSEIVTPPFPAIDNEMMQFIIEKADAEVAAGTSIESLICNVAANAWMEGHIEGYDRGRREAASE